MGLEGDGLSIIADCQLQLPEGGASEATAMVGPGLLSTAGFDSGIVSDRLGIIGNGHLHLTTASVGQSPAAVRGRTIGISGQAAEYADGHTIPRTLSSPAFDLAGVERQCPGEIIDSLVNFALPEVSLTTVKVGSRLFSAEGCSLLGTDGKESDGPGVIR